MTGPFTLQQLTLSLAGKEQIDAEIALGLAKKRLSTAKSAVAEILTKDDAPLSLVETAAFVRKTYKKS
jgi:hypothetical protein